MTEVLCRTAGERPKKSSTGPTPGGTLHGTDFPTSTQNRLEFTLRNAKPGAAAWLMLGFLPLVPELFLPGPWPWCRVEVLPVVAIPGTVGATGEFAWPVNVPHPRTGAYLYAQVASMAADSTKLLPSYGVLTMFPN